MVGLILSACSSANVSEEPIIEAEVVVSGSGGPLPPESGGLGPNDRRPGTQQTGTTDQPKPAAQNLCDIRPAYCSDDPEVLRDPNVIEDIFDLMAQGKLSGMTRGIAVEILENQTASVEPAAGGEDFPALMPWPPPKASRRLRLDKDLLWAEVGDNPSVGDVADHLADELLARDYDRVGFLNVPGDGFALLTGLEQIDDQAMPLEGASRWVEDIVVERNFSISAFLDALLFAPEGNYRVLVFIFTDETFRENPEETISTEILEEWSARSLVELPPEVADIAVAQDRHTLTALIYEFVKTDNQQSATLRLPGQWNAREHLEFSGLSRLAP